MAKQYIAYIAEVRLNSRASRRLSHGAYQRTATWLTQWTPKANFKAVIADTSEGCVAILKREPVVTEWLANESGVRNSDFEFEINRGDVIDGRLWVDPCLRVYVTHNFDDLPSAKEQP